MSTIPGGFLDPCTWSKDWSKEPFANPEPFDVSHDCTRVTLGLYRNCSAEMMGVWAEELRRSSSDRAVRRKRLVRSGQDVSVYGFSMASIAGVVSEESGG